MSGFGLAGGGSAAFGGQASAAATVEIDNSTPWMAASDGNLSLLQTSLTQLALSPNAADENGYTLLHAAASYGQMQVLQWLLSQPNMNINAVDNEGDSALHYASNEQAATVLIAAGINRHVQNQQGKTALASKQEELQEMLEDEDFEEDEDSTNLRGLVAYLSRLEENPQ